MHESAASDPFHGLFVQQSGTAGKLSRSVSSPATLPDPRTGYQLRIATVELSGAICPSCSERGDGGFVSFVSDLRLVFACPHCRELIWIAGA
jgi:hypothetical protein